MCKRREGDIGTSPGKQGKAVDFFVWRTLSIHTYAFFAALRNGFNTLEEDLLSFLTAFTATMYFFIAGVGRIIIKKFMLSKPSG
jgi:hypothetical protein